MTKEQKAYVFAIVAVTYLLVLFGIMIQLSMSPAANPSEPMRSFYRYLVTIGASTVFLIFFSYFNHRKLKKLAFPILILLFVSLFITKEVENSSRWVGIGNIPFAIQPSQYVALFLIALIAKVFSIDMDDEMIFKSQIFILLLLALFSAKVATQPDLGTASIIFLSTLLLLFSLLKDVKIVGGFTLLSLFAALIYIKTHPGPFERVAAFLHPEQHSQSGSYQLLQSLRAISRGGIYGVGLMNSFFKYGNLPLARFDFVFAIICEEFGFAGAMIVLALFFVLIYLGFRIVNIVPDMFSKILALGITIHISVSVIISIFVNVGLFPVTGVPLPIISYSGNNAIAIFSEIGVLINIVRRAYE